MNRWRLSGRNINLNNRNFKVQYPPKNMHCIGLAEVWRKEKKKGSIKIKTNQKK